jgi:putative glutamine amidotransferase
VPLPRIGITAEPVDGDGGRVDGAPRAYVRGVVAAGGVPVVLPVLGPELVEATLEGVDGLLVSGGGDIDPVRYGRLAGPRTDGVDADRDAFELPLVRAALASGLPILGVGRGLQVVNVALGGTLVAHLAGHGPDDDGPVAHDVRIAPGSLLAAVVGTTALAVQSAHHQALDLAGAGLQVVARAADGPVEAVEGLGDMRVLGVQWQPELALERPAHAALFRWLVSEASVHPEAGLLDLVRLDEVGPVPPSWTALAAPR